MKLGAEIDEEVGCGNKRESWGFYVGVLSLKKKNKTEGDVGFLGCGAELVKLSVEESLVFGREPFLEKATRKSFFFRCSKAKMKMKIRAFIELLCSLKINKSEPLFSVLCLFFCLTMIYEDH